MRKRATNEGISVNGISGLHTVYLGFDVTDEKRQGLLGFALKRADLTEDESYWLKGFKTFEANTQGIRPGEQVSTWDNPIQDFQWGDYTVKPGHQYTYTIVPVYGQPPDRLEHREGVSLSISSENEDDGVHAVFFNRGAAGSQAYARKFGNVPPDQVGPPALEWLSRGLLEAIIGFIQQAKGRGWGLRASVYEFNYIPVLQAFKTAIDNGVDVQIVYDNKKNGPGEANRKAMQQVGIGVANAIPRQSNPYYLSHNKFIVLLRDNAPVEVLTGSTNITEGGIFGHSNVAHVIHDANIAAAYLDYWNMLHGDPDANTLRPWCDTNSPVPAAQSPRTYIKPIFSCRGSMEALEWYAQKMDEATSSVFLTAAFGVNDLFMKILKEDKPYLRFILLDKPGKGLDIIKGDRDNQVSIGGVLEENKLDEWLGIRWRAEKLTGLNQHVQYIHTKYMLIDPLSDDPITITGSANFSKNSTTNNDENMVVIRGDKRVADMYLGEFMRLFDHFRLRGSPIGAKAQLKKGQPMHIYLVPDNSWTNPYFQQGNPRQKQRILFR